MRLIARFLPYYKKYKWILVLDLFCAALTTICELVLPLIVRRITDEATSVPMTLTVDLILRVQNTLHQIFLLVDQRGGQLGSVNLAIGHGHKLMAMIGKIPLDQFVGIIDNANRCDSKQAQMAAHQQRLGIGIGNAANAAAAVEFGDISLKFGSERGVLNVVDLALEAAHIVHDHTAPLGTQVGMVVHAEEHIHGYITPGNGAKKTAHVGFPP